MPWYISNRDIHRVLKVPWVADKMKWFDGKMQKYYEDTLIIRCHKLLDNGAARIPRLNRLKLTVNNHTHEKSDEICWIPDVLSSHTASQINTARQSYNSPITNVNKKIFFSIPSTTILFHLHLSPVPHYSPLQ